MRRYALAVGWFVLVLVVSLFPLPGGGAGTTAPANADLVVHGLSYALLAYLLGRGSSDRSRRTLVLTVVAVTLLGVGVEGVQGLTATRSVSAVDGIANAVGAGVGAGVWRISPQK